VRLSVHMHIRDTYPSSCMPCHLLLRPLSLHLPSGTQRVNQGSLFFYSTLTHPPTYLPFPSPRSQLPNRAFLLLLLVISYVVPMSTLIVIRVLLRKKNYPPRINDLTKKCRFCQYNNFPTLPPLPVLSRHGYSSFCPFPPDFFFFGSTWKSRALNYFSCSVNFLLKSVENKISEFFLCSLFGLFGMWCL
jgi:hypothetical protein